MVDRGLISLKLADLADRIARVRSRCPTTVDDLRADRDALDLVSFNLMLAVQTCSDIAAHIIADEGWPAAQSLAAAFNRLSAEGVVVAHGYGGINPAMVHAAATAGVRDIEAFSQEVARWVASRATPP